MTNGTFDGIAQPVMVANHVYFAVRFNVKMTERNGVIVCKTMNEILADSANQLDWTSKRIRGDDTVRYACNGLAQTNYFTYGTDKYTGDLSDDHGQGIFLVSNENLAQNQTIYSSPFAMSDMIFFSDRIFIANIPTGAAIPPSQRWVYIL